MDRTVRSGGNGDSRPVAVVTGARRGLGRAIALSLADAGFDLIINDIIEDKDSEDVVASLMGKGADARFIRHDVGDVAGHAEFVAKATAKFGRIDCLVNNAGVQVPRRVSLLEIEPGEFDGVLAVNLRGTFFLTQHFARWMIAEVPTPGSIPRSIITVTSANSVLASVDKAAYCLAKSALSMMTALFALELGRHNIGVFEIRPGLMTTDMTVAVREKYASYVDQTTVFGRWGEPEDVGRAAAAIATGTIPYSSGQIINVDGGMHIPRQ
jgi:NAD(P)-dependent dehydrogenase (short-subunit alcohol dehydrogenase family)